MSLAPGARLGPYEILQPIGAGGMGEVYRARDTRLDRAVAVKVLPPAFSSTAASRQRFEREAQTISRLSHPHICAIYDVGDHDGTAFLVMELLEGETLSARLDRGPLAPADVARLGAEIAEALDAAHRGGIVHRDLKPANIMLTRSGAKLLDFGIAKPSAAAATVGISAATIAVASDLTAEGSVLGTAGYMAPEQLEGRPADSRTDIFALGAVLYQMATGRRAFPGASRSAVASAVLRDDPQPIEVWPALDRLVRVCLAKDPEQRWQTARDVALQLSSLTASGAHTAGVPAHARPRSLRRALPWGVAVVCALGAIAGFARPRVSLTATPVIRFPLPPPPGNVFFQDVETAGVAVSPDGLRIAFSASDAAGMRHAWLRLVGELDARPIEGTEGATSMFWSPDGTALAFFTDDKLRRVDLGGGAPVTICDSRAGIRLFGTWGGDGQILFTAIEGDAIYSVPSSGGTATPILKPDPARNEARLNFPSFLPDGRRYLYLRRLRGGGGQLMLADPGQPARELMPLLSAAHYVDPGYLIYAVDGALLGRRFDATGGAVLGEPFSIAQSVKYFLSTSVAEFSASRAGTLAYQTHHNEQRLVWFDRSGREVGTVGEAGEYKGLRFSPDGRRILFDRLKSGAFDVWEMNLERQVETRLTLNPSSEGAGPWMADGRSIFFNADHGAAPEIFRKDLATGRDEAAVPASSTFQQPDDVSPDGKWLLYTQRTAVGGNDIWLVALDASRPPSVVFETPFDENEPRFSPDGHLFSFSSNASGRQEIYVTPFPVAGERVRVSTGGGFGARWSRNGRELFYRSGNQVMSAPIQTAPALRVDQPVALFNVAKERAWFGFDVAPDGRFIAVVSQTRAVEQPLTVVLNWTAALSR
jgi:Tol biopolymer transport system component/tRNA A-37 threonylcarbamoyl transferase component Bud32